MSIAGPPRVGLAVRKLHYKPGYEVHTASSGRLDCLRSLYLTLDYGDVVGHSEIRTNIGYLTGVSEAALEHAVERALGDIVLSADPAGDRERIDAILPGAAVGLRLLVECALADAAARRQGKTVAALLGSANPPLEYGTNQTLFLLNDTLLAERADEYVARGFQSLKLRMGDQQVSSDLVRARALRDRFGDTVRLSCDVNGGWDFEKAKLALGHLAELGFDYVEQPLPAGHLGATARLAQDSGMKIMLDEDISDIEGVRVAISLDVPLMLHLKLAKLGGLDRLKAATEIARSAGREVMIGQMNEGSLATAAALNAVAALQPDLAELYGADNLVDDPFDGLRYADGRVSAIGRLGFGLEPGSSFSPGAFF